MKVGSINNITFCSGNQIQKPVQNKYDNPQIKELTPVTPDFGIKIPQTYKKIAEYELDNGLKLYSYKLSNGLKVSIVPMEDSPAVVKSYVNVGSMNETPDIKGISHFLEHMAFNGTNGENGHIKLEVGDSFKKIDELGGWANASTNYAITDYVNSTPLLNKSDLEQQIKVIAAMSEDLKLSEEMIEKEKHPVCSEINMILDDPQTIALDQTIRTLFEIDNPADEMVGGSVKHIKNLTRKDVKDYYDKYYTPDNMNVVITGDVDPDEAIELVAKNFTSKKSSSGKRFEEKLSPITNTVRKDITCDKATSCEVVLGFAGPHNTDNREVVIFDLAKAYLSSYACDLNKNLKPYNTGLFINSEKISTNKNAPRFVYAAASVSEENGEEVLNTIIDTISNVKIPEEETLEELKQSILNYKSDSFEYSSEVNDIIGYAVLNNNINYVTDYNKIMESITPEEVYNGIKKYFDVNKAAITLIHPEKTSSPAFKGNRKPINESKISEFVLDNQFNLGLYKTKNKNLTYNVSLYTNTPYNKKAGVVEVLNEMYSMGTENLDEDEIKKFQDKNNLEIYSSVNNNSIKITVNGCYDKRDLINQITEDKLYRPRFTEENLSRAKDRIKDFMSRIQYYSQTLYGNNEAEKNPYEFTDEEILKNIDNITLDDVKDCHNYLLSNSRGIITANIPESYPEYANEIIEKANRLKDVMPNDVQTLNIYKTPEKTEVLTHVNNNSQADIMQVHKFKHDGSIRTFVLGNLLNSILTNSSIGLFNTLRERDHLAYSVYSDIQKIGDCGEISCNILTTTDNKNIGEISYDNVQKSINGFNTQINALKSGEFTDKDVENAKLALKANLLQKEGVSSKLSSINLGMNSIHGITYSNKLYDEIDTITKEDIINFANEIFENPPIYSIVASKDTLDYNKDYFDSL